jgi:CubicO group peptidase (beta-lactamase class C family)
MVRARFRVGVAIFALAGGATLVAGQQKVLPEAAARGLSKATELYRARLAEAGIVGSALALVREGGIAAECYEGYADLTTKQMVDRDTIFHWASITKTFTGIAVMQLRDRGLLRLDDPAVQYLPELRQVHNPYGDMTQVTIRQLMSHTAGFRAATWPWGGDKSWHPFEPTRWDQVVAMFPYTEILFPPGSKYSYSNPGVIFLGRIIELLSGDDYEVYVTKNILMPLGMHATFFDRAPYHLVKHRSHSYFRADGVLREAPFDFDTGITVSNGGLNSPFADMAKYVAFLIGGDARRAKYDGILARASLEEMFQPVIAASEGEGGSGGDVRVALSFFVERYGPETLIGHSGSQNGFISHLYLHPRSRSGYIVNFNTEASSTRPSPREVSRAVDADVRDVLLREVFARLEKVQ